MSQKINRIPYGFLDFLEIKSFGRNPDEVASTIAPVLDLLQWYLVDEREVAIATGLTATATNNALTGIAVPDNEVWYVHSYALSTGALGAGQSLLLQPYLSPPNSPSASTYQFQPVDRIATAGQLFRCAYNDFWAPPGYAFGFTPLVNVAGPYAAVAAVVQYNAFSR